MLWLKIESGRIRLPHDLVQRLPWLIGSGNLEAWLLVLEPGRYRLLSPEQVQMSSQLRSLLELNTEIGSVDASVDPIDAETAEAAAMRTRLWPTTLNPHSGGAWRLTLPTHLPPILKNGVIVYVLSSDGYVEVWSAECWIRATAHPA